MNATWHKPPPNSSHDTSTPQWHCSVQELSEEGDKELKVLTQYQGCPNQKVVKQSEDVPEKLWSTEAGLTVHRGKIKNGVSVQIFMDVSRYNRHSFQLGFQDYCQWTWNMVTIFPSVPEVLNKRIENTMKLNFDFLDIKSHHQMSSYPDRFMWEMIWFVYEFFS